MGIVITTITGIVLSSLLGMSWFGLSGFGSTWLKLQFPGKNRDDVLKDGPSPGILIGMTILTNFVYFPLLYTAFGFLVDAAASLIVHLEFGALIAAIVCLSQVPHYLYAQISHKLFLINQGYNAVLILLFSAAYFFTRSVLI